MRRQRPHQQLLRETHLRVRRHLESPQLDVYKRQTFDGSSIRGFAAQKESDLRLGIDWSAFYWGPADVFGGGKVMVFGEVIGKDGGPYPADLRAVLKAYANEVYNKDGYTLNAADEIEGFVFKGVDAERRYHETGKFEYVSAGGYYHSLPGDTLRLFIDCLLYTSVAAV